MRSCQNVDQVISSSDRDGSPLKGQPFNSSAWTLIGVHREVAKMDNKDTQPNNERVDGNRFEYLLYIQTAGLT